MPPFPIEERRRSQLVAAPRRVNRWISLWDEPDAMPLMPPAPRPWVGVPALDREQLEGLRAELLGALDEFEAHSG